jgi:hypothetical protein
MVKLSKAVEVPDVAFHLKVRFGADVVVGSNSNGFLRVNWRQGED